MRYEGIPFTNAVRQELRRTITGTFKWREWRSMNPDAPAISRMNRDELLAAADALKIDVYALIERVGARTGRRHRASKFNDQYDKRTDAVAKLESLGYAYIAGKWISAQKWD